MPFTTRRPIRSLQNHAQSAEGQGGGGFKGGGLLGHTARLLTQPGGKQRLRQLHLVQSFFGMLGGHLPVHVQSFFDPAGGNEGKPSVIEGDKIGSAFRAFTTASRRSRACCTVNRVLGLSTRKTASTIVPSALAEYFWVKFRVSTFSVLSEGRARSLKPSGAVTL